MEQKTNASSITRQLQAVFAVSIVILLISSVASLYTNNRLIQSSQWVNHTNEVLLNTENLISSVKDAETGQRGFIITNDKNFLQPYNGGYEKTIGILDHLKQLSADNPFQQAKLDTARRLITERYQQMQRVIDISLRASVAQRSTLFLDSYAEMARGKKLMDDLRAAVEEIKAEERRLLAKRVGEQETYITYTPVMVGLAALLSIIITLLAYFRIKADLDARVRKQKEDELIYAETNRRINAMEQVTGMIAAGDYSVRSADSAKDDLGRISAALNSMVVSLEVNFNALQQKDWLQTGAVKISDAIRGERFVKNVAEKVVASIAAHMSAHVGTLYIADKDLNLKLYGTYAAQAAPAELPAGTGLMGQAVKSKDIFVSDKLPEGYLKVGSSIGSTPASYAIIMPVMFNHSVVGVMELGMLHKPTDIEVAFLKENAENIGISIHAAINYEKMQDLLEETQAQSEELQSQHSELENINAELEVQTEKLQASEEELRVQQEELQQANSELEERSRLLEEKNQQIHERNIEVQRKAEELEVSTKYKSEFLANMSHELRTPLNSILLLSRLLSENTETNLNEEQVEYAKVINGSGNGLLSLIDEILDLSKIEAGKMELEYQQVPLAEIADDMRMLFAPVAKEKGLEFSVSADASLTEVETDKMRLEQVIKNLISNALKFTREGSVHLSISKDKRRAGFVAFEVIDTGIGIAADKQKLIFEAFQQADGSTRRKYGGTGLGLSISKELARLLNGDLYVKSEADKGSTFTVTVPIVRTEQILHEDDAEEEVQVAEEIAPVPVADGSEYRALNIPENIPDDRATIKKGDKIILIVEDDVNFAKSLAQFTRQKGYKCIISVRGDEGVELARNYLPIGVLLDITLPVKSGWEVMEELKADPHTRHIPVHIMSSHSVKKESLMKGAINFINKPVAIDQMHEIFSKLEHVLSRANNTKVLIVEENPRHAKALSYFLETFNINSDIKNTVNESIEALKNDADCVILDMGVPDTNAYNTLDKIKKTPGLENLPIIVFTGKSLSMAEEGRIKQYADSIVVKTAHSYQRILDEVSLFLHVVEENKNTPKNAVKRLGALNDVLKGKTVLIVDDDVRNIFSLTKALEKANMNIMTAIDGKEAMKQLQENAGIDAVLLDMMMPQMDGYETARKIRENSEWKRLPVIAVTAKAMAGDREKCIQAGASDYITKPVDLDQLLSLLRVWLYEKNANTTYAG
ncbi:MAG: response regulator [Bacteroidota bacterium]